MTTISDIVLVSDCAFSMTFAFDRVREAMIGAARMVLDASDQNRVGFLKLQPGSSRIFTVVYPLTNNINTFQRWIDNSHVGDEGSCNRKAIGEAMEEALSFPWRTSDNDEIFHEKLVLIFTDNAPHGYNAQFVDKDSRSIPNTFRTPHDCNRQIVGVNPWPISHAFRDNKITLAVVGVVTSVFWCDDFYDKLARNTGGDYIPMIRFENQFESIFNMVAHGGYTFSQALLRI